MHLFDNHVQFAKSAIIINKFHTKTTLIFSFLIISKFFLYSCPCSLLLLITFTFLSCLSLHCYLSEPTIAIILRFSISRKRKRQRPLMIVSIRMWLSLSSRQLILLKWGLRKLIMHQMLRVRLLLMLFKFSLTTPSLLNRPIQPTFSPTFHLVRTSSMKSTLSKDQLTGSKKSLWSSFHQKLSKKKKTKSKLWSEGRAESSRKTVRKKMSNAQVQAKTQALTAQDTQTWTKRRKKATERSESGSRKQSECKRRTWGESSKELKTMLWKWLKSTESRKVKLRQKCVSKDDLFILLSCLFVYCLSLENDRVINEGCINNR